MLYKQNIDYMVKNTVFNDIIEEYNKIIKDAEIILDNLKLNRNEDFLLSTAQIDHDIKEIEKIAGIIRDNFNKLIILGTGGSSLNGQIFCALSDKKIQIDFLENIDPHTIDEAINGLDAKNTAILCISKSGTTPETLAQFLVIMAYYQEQQIDLSKNLFVITDLKPNPLKNIATEIGATILEHLPVGGRFATFTSVGLLPAAIAGLDIKEIRLGANNVLSNNSYQPAIGAAINLASMKMGHNINVIMTYVDRLESLVNWHCQIWAESLGKNNQGSTPLKAKGTIDQHSQLQLYLDGPKDKLFTIITKANLKNSGCKIPQILNDQGIEFLQGKTIGDLMAAEQQATIESLIHNKCPTRNIIVENIDGATLGALAMHFILETLIFAKMKKIEPFTQPAVEAGKIRTKQLMMI